MEEGVKASPASRIEARPEGATEDPLERGDALAQERWRRVPASQQKEGQVVEVPSETAGQVGEGQGAGPGPACDDSISIRRPLLPGRHELVQFFHESAGPRPAVPRGRGSGAAAGQAEDELPFRRALRKKATQEEQGVGALLGAVGRGEAHDVGLVPAAPAEGEKAPGRVRDGQAATARRGEEGRRIAEPMGQGSMGHGQGVHEPGEDLGAPAEEKGPILGEGGDGRGGKDEHREDHEGEARHGGSFPVDPVPMQGAGQAGVGGGAGHGERRAAAGRTGSVASRSTRSAPMWTPSLHLE